MYVFSKQAMRKKPVISLSIILLALSAMLLSAGYTALQETGKMNAQIDSRYTTIGIHAGLNYDGFYYAGGGVPTGLDSTRFHDGSVYIGPYDARKCAEASPDYLSASNAVLLSAYVEGTTALTSGTMDILEYIVSHDAHCYNLAVFAVEITSITEDEDPYIWKRYTLEARILDNVCLMDVYDLPPENDIIKITTSLYTAGGQIPFEVGKTYLVRGHYWDYTIDDLGFQKVIDEEGREVMKWVRGRNIENDSRILQMEGDGSLVEGMTMPGLASGVQNFVYNIHKDADTELIYFSTPGNNCWPYFAEYEGSWQDYLASDAGTVWREEIIPNFEMNHASAPVILTNNVDSMYLFNSGDASILEGRTIEKAEYEKGDAVCLVSASYAKLNGLTVGDTISLDYFNSGYEQTSCVISSANSHSSLTIDRKPLTENTRMNIKKDYTIVGLYTSPEWTPGVQNFHADTIFVPKASVPGADQIITKMDVRYNSSTISMLNSIVIKNGSIDEFEAYMAANDMAGVYLYFDQGYSEAVTSVQTMIDNSMRLMLVGIAMFVLSSLLFLLLFMRRSAPAIRTMRLIGVSAKKTWRECFSTLLVQITTAVTIGNGLAILLYDQISQQILSSIPKLSIGNVALCGAVQFLALVVVGSAWTHFVAKRNLMQKG